jgi:hypothetical protein
VGASYNRKTFRYGSVASVMISVGASIVIAIAVEIGPERRLNTVFGPIDTTVER